MKTKTYNLKPVRCTMESNNFPKGLLLKRELTTDEARHIMIHCFGINILTRGECDYLEEYKEYNKELTLCVNNWLKGERDDSSIMEYAYDCSDEQLGIINMLSVLVYLQKREII